ncbi:hypothetical protein PR048_022613 [Dryococelus australis]|uniref:Uncharacterized protein n=1 Tax=Dryococelus australis TaxID=614101 RepID=A0ABQ9H1G7_9NEOP|nr:hypothetical protein PR048_022613 [Dryococelus australis]
MRLHRQIQFQRPVECIELSSDDERSKEPDSSQPSPQAMIFAPLKDCSQTVLQVGNSSDAQDCRKRHLLDDCHIPCKMQLDSGFMHGLVSSTSCSHAGVEPPTASGQECLGTFSRSDTPLTTLVPVETLGNYPPLSNCIDSPAAGSVQVATVPSPSLLAKCPQLAAVTCCPHTEKHSKSACVVEHSLPAVIMCHPQCMPVCRPANGVEHSHPPVVESSTHSVTNSCSTGRLESPQSSFVPCFSPSVPLFKSSAVMECSQSLVDRHSPHYVTDPEPANMTGHLQPVMDTHVSAPVPYQKHAEVVQHSHTMIDLHLTPKPASMAECSPLVIDPCSPHSVTDAKTSSVIECSALVIDPCFSNSVIDPKPAAVTQLMIDARSSATETEPKLTDVLEHLKIVNYPCSSNSVTDPIPLEISESSQLVIDTGSSDSKLGSKLMGVIEHSQIEMEPCSLNSMADPKPTEMSESSQRVIETVSSDSETDEMERSRLVMDPSSSNPVKDPKPADVTRLMIDTQSSASETEPILMDVMEHSQIVNHPCSSNSVADPKLTDLSESSQLVIDTVSSDSETDEMERSRLVMDPSSSNSVNDPKPANVTRLMINTQSSASETEPKLFDVMEHSQIVKDPFSLNSVIDPKPSDLSESSQLVIDTDPSDCDSEPEQACGVETAEPFVTSLSNMSVSPPPSVNTPICPPCVVVLTMSSIVDRRMSPASAGAEQNSCPPAPVVPSHVAAASSLLRTSSSVEDSAPAETKVSSPTSTVPPAKLFLSTSPNVYSTDDDDMMEEQPVVIKSEFPKNVFAEDEIITISDDEAYPSSQLFEETEANETEGANRTVLEDESDSFDHFLFLDLHADSSDLHPSATDNMDQNEKNIGSERIEAEVTRMEDVGDYEVSRDQPSTSRIVDNKTSPEGTRKERRHKRKPLKTSKRVSTVEKAVKSKNKKEREEKLKSLCKKVKEAHREERKEILHSKSEEEVQRCKKSPMKALPLNIKITDKNRSAMLTEAILAPVARPRGRLMTSTTSKVKNVKQDVKKIIESKNKLHCPAPVESRPPLKRIDEQQVRRIPKLSFKDLAQPSTSTANSAVSMQSPLSSQVLGLSSALMTRSLTAARLPDPAPREKLRKKSVRFQEGSQLEQVCNIPALQRDERALAAPQGNMFRGGNIVNMSDIIQEICTWKTSWFRVSELPQIACPNQKDSMVVLVTFYGVLFTRRGSLI